MALSKQEWLALEKKANDLTSTSDHRSGQEAAILAAA